MLAGPRVLRPYPLHIIMDMENNISSQMGMAVSHMQKAKQKFDKDPADESVDDDLISALDFMVMAIRLYKNYRKTDVV